MLNYQQQYQTYYHLNMHKSLYICNQMPLQWVGYLLKEEWVQNWGFIGKKDFQNLIKKQQELHLLDKFIKQYREAADLDEITRLSHLLIERLHDQAGYIPAWTKPWYRVGYWRWVKWPDGFNAKQRRDWEELHLHWLDPAAKTKTLEAVKDGKTFGKVVKVHDQHRK